MVRSTFPRKNVQNTPTSDHLWKLGCRKSARWCSVKHMTKSKCTKHTNVGPLLELEMSKKCTPLWREAHVEVKMLTTPHAWTTFWSCDVEKGHALVARSTFPSEHVKNNHMLGPLFDVQMSKVYAVVARSKFPSQKCKKLKVFSLFLTLRWRKSAHWLT